MGTRSFNGLAGCGGVRKDALVVLMRGGEMRSLERALPKRGRVGEDISMSVSSNRSGETCTVMEEVVLVDALLKSEPLRAIFGGGSNAFSSGRLSSPEVSSGVNGAGGLHELNVGARGRTLRGDGLMASEPIALRLR